MPTTVQSILQRVVDQLGEEDFTNWSLPSLVRYLNDGQKTIMVHRPDLFNVEAELIMVAGHRQTLPPGATKLIALNYNTVGNKGSIYKCERNILDLQVRNWRSMRGVLDIEHFMYDVRQPLVYEVYPPAAVGARAMGEYAVLPADVPVPSDTDELSDVEGNISVPDAQSVPLYYFILFSAYAEDTEPSDAQRSLAYRTLFANDLGIEFQATTSVAPTSTTP